MTLLLDYARSIGAQMGSLHAGRHIGWTTDEQKAELLRARGARVMPGCNSVGPRGWELSFEVGAEAIEPPEVAA